MYTGKLANILYKFSIYIYLILAVCAKKTAKIAKKSIHRILAVILAIFWRLCKNQTVAITGFIVI